MTEPTRILLVVTGKLEEVALADALSGVFPTTEFVSQWTQGFTSTPLPDPDLQALATKTVKTEDLVNKLLGAAVSKTPGGPPFDFAIAFEDVELANEPEVGPLDIGVERIVAHFAQGIDRSLRRLDVPQTEPTVLPKGKAKRFPPPPRTDAERRRFLRERCSFHLFRPMPEALFFGDPAGLTNAAGPGIRPPQVHFDPGTCDIESFRTSDPGYLGPPDRWQPPGLSAEAAWAKPRRERHPKHYVEYLLDPSGTVPRPYKEVVHGARALRALDWQSVVTHASFAQMVRALLDDIADMVGARLPWIADQPLHPLTCRKQGGRLRNLL